MPHPIITEQWSIYLNVLPSPHLNVHPNNIFTFTYNVAHPIHNTRPPPPLRSSTAPVYGQRPPDYGHRLTQYHGKPNNIIVCRNHRCWPSQASTTCWWWSSCAGRQHRITMERGQGFVLPDRQPPTVYSAGCRDALFFVTEQCGRSVGRSDSIEDYSNRQSYTGHVSSTAGRKPNSTLPFLSRKKT